ncbi:MAG TPA: hypothetical protein VFR86_15745, partial [Burkholderiaceae bacterium]|nr:hypothetical protein [Burkholderiaceae bacterium]
FHSWMPDALLQPAQREEALVHLFDEPQFNTQDGYIGFMLQFFRRLRAAGKLVFVCVHPNERFQLELLRELSERFVFISRGALTECASYEQMLALPAAREYLGRLAD